MLKNATKAELLFELRHTIMINSSKMSMVIETAINEECFLSPSYFITIPANQVTIQQINTIVNQYLVEIRHCKNEGKLARIQIISYYSSALSSIF